MEFSSVENLQVPSHMLLLKQRARRNPIKITHRGFSRNKSIKCKFFDNSKPQLQICHEVGHTASTRCHFFDSDFQPKNNDPSEGLMRKTLWTFDTGARYHITGDLNSLKLRKPFGYEEKVMVGNGNILSISHTGIASINSSERPLILKEVLYVPKTKINLMSVKRLCEDNNIYMEFYSSEFVVKDQKTHQVLLKGETNNGEYVVVVANGYRNARAALKKSHRDIIYLIKSTSFFSMVGVAFMRTRIQEVSSFYFPVYL